MMHDFNAEEWECPKCGHTITAPGPASLKWAIHNHEYFEHTRKERGLPEIPKHIGMPGHIPDVFKPRYDAASIPFDEAFYDGARLSQFDRGFFRALRVLWVNSKHLTA
jgi:hypothetical protein